MTYRFILIVNVELLVRELIVLIVRELIVLLVRELIVLSVRELIVLLVRCLAILIDVLWSKMSLLSFALTAIFTSNKILRKF